MFFYRLFGLLVACEFEIPFASVASRAHAPQVRVCFGEMPFDIKKHPSRVVLQERFVFCKADENTLVFCADGFEFAVLSGKQILVHPPKTAYDRIKLHTFLLGTAFGALFMQRGDVPLHGTALKCRGGALVLVGASGAGKSALSAALIQRGVHYLADDVSVLCEREGVQMILPAYPQRKVPADVAKQLCINAQSLEKITEDGREKYTVQEKSEWCAQPMPLKYIVEIVAAERKDGCSFSPTVYPKGGKDALLLLHRNLYRKPFYEQGGLPAEKMGAILRAAAQSEAVQLIRPQEGCPVQLCVDALTQQGII